MFFLTMMIVQTLKYNVLRKKNDQLLRSIFYSGKLLSTTLKGGEKYEKMRFIHQIMFANFTHFKDDNKFIHNFRLKDDDGNLATDRYSVHFIEIAEPHSRFPLKKKLHFEKLDRSVCGSVITATPLFEALKKIEFSKLPPARSTKA